MADNISMQGLEFSIETNSEKASKGIDSLVNSLNKLSTALKGTVNLTKTVNQLEKISAVLQTANIDKLGKLGTALNNLKNVKISATVPKRLAEIGSVLSGISSSKIEKISQLGNSMKNITTPVSQNIPEMEAASSDKIQVKNQPVSQDQSTNSAYNANSAAKNLKESTKTISSAFKSANTEMKLFAKEGNIVGSVMKNLAAQFGSNIGNKIKSTVSGLKQFFTSLKRIAMYRAIRFFFSQLSQSMREGINNLYQYSALMGGTFKGSMDSLATSFQYLRNSLGAMAAPILNALAPAIDYLIDKFVALINIINQFFARLTGQSTFVRAKKATANYADTLGDTAGAAKKAAKAIKEIRDATIGIDELNIISPNDDNDDTGGGSGGGAGGGQGFADMFETLPIDSAISEFADKLKAAFEAGDWKRLGTLLGEKVNEIVDSIDWKEVGHKLGYGLNGAIQTLYYFLKTVDFQNIGKRISELLNGTMEEIDFNILGRLLVREFTILPDFIIGIIEGLNWGLLGKSFGDFLIGVFQEGFEWISSINWIQLADDLLNGLLDFIVNIDYGNLVKSFVKLLASAWSVFPQLVIGIAKFIVETIYNGIMSFLKNDDGGFKSGEEIIKSVLEGIKSVIIGIPTWIWENVVSPFIEGFSSGFGINGDTSSVMETLGNNVINGFEAGLGFITSIAGKVQEWSGKVYEWFAKGSSGKGLIGDFKELAGDTVKGFKDKIGNTYNTVKEKITTWAEKIKDWFTEDNFGGVNLKTFGEFAGDTIEGFKSKIGNTYTNVKDNITTWAGKVKEWFTGNSDGGVNANTFSIFGNAIVEGFKTKIVNVYTSVQSSITTWAESVKTWFSSIVSWDAFTGFATNIINGFISGVGNFFGSCFDIIKGWGNSVVRWFSDIVSFDTFYNIASNVIEGFKNGIGALFNNSKDAMTGWAEKVIGWFSGTLDEGSPSRVFYELGEFAVIGFNNAITEVGKTTKKVVNNWSDSFTKITPQLAMAVDTSTLDYYDSEAYARSVSARITGSTEITSDGFLYAMKVFYRNYLEPTINQMADDIHRQADKETQPIVQIGNRVITDAVETQQKANGYRFIK